ncbi:MAG: histidine phosphatase family protein [Ktedonobacterales bacterium]|nr:histidine phosphatase family protein [Ktedonobacterales bacterium]
MDQSSRNAADQGAPAASAEAIKVRYLLLVRHGQATFNLDGRHPGQLPGIPLTDEGRRQAHAAAVALAALPLSTIIASPLERARGTAEIIARGWALPVRLDPRLMDTDVGPWAGKKPDELKNDAAWKAFVAHPTEPPPGVESLAAVQARAMSVVEEVVRDAESGSYIVLVTHGDIVKLILGHYLGIHIECVRFLAIANASVSALAFAGEHPPEALAINWTASPHWLGGLPVPVAEAAASALPAPSAEVAASADVAERAGS